jgi:hypothetical protein
MFLGDTRVLLPDENVTNIVVLDGKRAFAGPTHPV